VAVSNRKAHPGGTDVNDKGVIVTGDIVDIRVHQAERS
jgi:hypothetical protein